MSLKKFKFHTKPDVRLVIMDNTVYKIKLTCQRKSESENLKELCKAACCQSELEKAVCAILYTDKQEPILTESFIIYPYKKKWETACKLKFEHRGEALPVNNSMYTLYVEPRKNTQDEDKNPVSATRKRRSFEESPDQATVKKPTVQTVTEYGQKNRHDIESLNIREHLRMQEMAKPTLKSTVEEPPKPTGFINSIKRLLGR